MKNPYASINPAEIGMTPSQFDAMNRAASAFCKGFAGRDDTSASLTELVGLVFRAGWVGGTRRAMSEIPSRSPAV